MIVLDTLDFTCEALYRRGIRRYMDFSTGIVGIKRGISWQSLRESLYVPSRPGVKLKYPSKEQIRRLAFQLEKSGLILSKSQGKKLIFWCPLAHSDKSVQKKADTKPTDLADTNTDSLISANSLIKSRKNRKSNTEAVTKADTPNSRKADTPPVSGNTNINTNVFILSDLEKTFDDFFWKVYPVHVKKKQAFEIYKRKKLYLVKEKICEDVYTRLKSHRPWLEGYIPHPTTYLNGERWTDEIEEQQSARVQKSDKYQSIMQVIQTCAPN